MNLGLRYEKEVVSVFAILGAREMKLMVFISWGLVLQSGERQSLLSCWWGGSVRGSAVWYEVIRKVM